MPSEQQFCKTPGWLDYHAKPSRPRLILPPGAVDAHCHIFGPGHLFPYAPERKYTPTDAPKETLFALRDYLGFEKNVIVQATCHGKNNQVLVDALRTAKGRARGVAMLDTSASELELKKLHNEGVRGVRFTFLKRLTERISYTDINRLVSRIAPLGWHLVVYFEANELPEIYDFLASLPIAVVVDHMGLPDVSKPLHNA